MTQLLAKSSKSGQPCKTLLDHTRDVLNAIEALFGRVDQPTRLAEVWMRFFGLSKADFDRFLRHLRIAAALHDWGKANDGFQGAVKNGDEQAVRHEHLSALLLADLITDKAILAWLQGGACDELVLLAAVVSHHVKAGQKTVESPLIGALRSIVRFHCDHEDFTTIWHMTQSEVGSPCPVSARFPVLWKKDEIGAKGGALARRLNEGRSRLRGDLSRRRQMGAVRAAIVADAVGSAVVRMDGAERDDPKATLDRWIDQCFSAVLTSHDVWAGIVKQRIADLRARKRWNDSSGVEFGDERGFSAFQVGVAKQGPRVLLTAPCGSGKTLAAWNWIKSQLDQRPTARVLFLYPTRATATEGFHDYVSWAPEDDAGLLSGTADYELQDMFETPNDAGDPRKGRNYRSDPRLYALGHWKKRIFSATADQFFPFMQYGYGPLCLLPLLVDSVLVVDEVHSFDKSMFSTLKRFLTEFVDVPVLCMTATLPVERTNTLVNDCKLRPYPETPPADLVSDSSHPRYHVEWVDRHQADELVREALDERKRVLWVANRVSDCQKVFRQFYDDLSVSLGELDVFCYHSRFKLDDRKKRHRELIRAFQEAAKAVARPRAVLGATTQVCEMSLDLDAEILVTELAPISSLIQRMGRCNRDSVKMRGRPIGRVCVLRPEGGKEKPYEKEELDVAAVFVDQITGRDVSQDELQRVYEECDPSEVEPSKSCPFLDSGPYAEARVESFRETDDFTVPCILDRDEMSVAAAITGRRPIDGFIVPVPRYLAAPPGVGSSRLPRWLSVAPGSRYDKLIGFDDRPRLSGEGDRDS